MMAATVTPVAVFTTRLAGPVTPRFLSCCLWNTEQVLVEVLGVIEDILSDQFKEFTASRGIHNHSQQFSRLASPAAPQPELLLMSMITNVAPAPWRRRFAQ